MYRIIEVIIEIILLIIGINYLVILIPGIFIRIFQNLSINNKVFKLYSWLQVDKEKDYSARDDIKHMLAHKFVGLVSNNIDIVILSSFIGSKVVTIYAAYNYLIKYANDTVIHIFNSMKDALGNILHTEQKPKIKEIIDEFYIIFAYIGSVIVIVFYYVLNDFVEIWVGSSYIVSNYALVLFLFILYNNISIRSMTIVRTTMGLFKETKIMAVIEAAINLLLSFILVQNYGLEGVLLATIIAFLLTNFWFQPYIVYKKLFNEGVLKYIIKILVSNCLIIISIYVFSYIYPSIDVHIFNINIINWIISAVIILVIVSITLLITYGFLYKEFRRVVNKGLKVILHR